MNLDQELFYLIHHELANPFLDTVLPHYRDKLTWVPLYLVAAFLLWKQHRYDGLRLLLLVGIAITISDQLTSSVIKPLVGRARPCYAPEFTDVLRELVGCGGHDSFPSSHAANHFALATLLSMTWLRNHRGWIWAFMLWAASISLAQVYVAKHYPLDILAGGVLGAVVAIIVVLLAKRLDFLQPSTFNEPMSKVLADDHQTTER